MKWILFNSAFLTCTCFILCQDIVFPNDEELSHVSGNKPMVCVIIQNAFYVQAICYIMK